MAIGDGRKVQGITKQAIERICALADFVEKNKFHAEITMTVNEAWEIDRCKENWAGFKEVGGALVYKCVTVVMG
ncbi:MAG: hypothetical protein CVU71_03845 [Deltaproteobacteria bacterium HGW-Deltaproteobacteria-6]|jgi:hypothetical protein|nr:MAG: hypothetical protein CVU71_03845 [Deltaproteobacteria bacterium HGW-Deltaproteobacteria-6]